MTNTTESFQSLIDFQNEMNNLQKKKEKYNVIAHNALENLEQEYSNKERITKEELNKKLEERKKQLFEYTDSIKIWFNEEEKSLRKINELTVNLDNIFSGGSKKIKKHKSKSIKRKSKFRTQKY